ncbi:putative phycocyanobilin lyase CpcS 2 [Hyella patelloides LEGE 07179]|uniref:Chromophore lyase CpcS/CpeS n=1 Tax=Hyella patelloides LEGE 07179 TaxID=945734 RepID=A0A563W3J9_9CYAN|nr:phycobiliprotein lyase [Hyella patelloides]VEP18248.1 putative phycocyanobilin lyase CpcS 2 [Hyella patelloides LEGE 07179]
MISTNSINTRVESLAVNYFQRSQGKWKSQRRYYMLNQETEPQEVESILTVEYLEQGTPELLELAQLHQLEQPNILVCGTKVAWSSNYTNRNRKASEGSTIFGIAGNQLYRDRGFATDKPIIAICSFTNPDTLCLRTEYNNSVFEEEVKLVGQNYRTRQTIISRAQKEITIGQYLETRIK